MITRPPTKTGEVPRKNKSTGKEPKKGTKTIQWGRGQFSPHQCCLKQSCESLAVTGLSLSHGAGPLPPCTYPETGEDRVSLSPSHHAQKLNQNWVKCQTVRSTTLKLLGDKATLWHWYRANFLKMAITVPKVQQGLRVLRRREGFSHRGSNDPWGFSPQHWRKSIRHP